MTTIRGSADGEGWIAEFFPDAIEESVETNDEKGWKVTTGFLDGEGVPIRALYRQDMYSSADVQKLAENLRECPICQRLGRDMSITSIEVPNNYVLQNQRAQPAPSDAGMGLNRREQPAPPIGDMSGRFMDALFNTVLNTTLTPLGQIMTARITGNDEMLQRALPKTDADMQNIAADYFSANTPNKMIFRDPAEMKKLARALRVKNVSVDDVDAEKKPVFRRARTMIIS